jgi:magnesium transporter
LRPRGSATSPLRLPTVETWSFDGNAWSPGEASDARLRWFNLCGDDAGELDVLGRRFNLHPLAIEDCHSTQLHTPKVDDFGDYLFIVLLTLVDGDEGPEPDELDIFLGRDFLLTYQDRPAGPHALEAVSEAVRKGVALRPGADGLCYEIADRLVDAILPEVNALSDRLDGIENEIVVSGRPREQHFEILELRALAGRIRRLLTPQLVVIQHLSRGESELVAPANRMYFRDIYDHLVRADLALESLREDAEVALSTYLSQINNRLNEVMKVLAVVGALALPATVITGVFGTNFDNVPGLHDAWGFAAMMAGMAALAGGMAYYFRRRGWF